MSNRRPDPDHQAAVSRRLETLNAELDWSAGHTRVRPATRTEDGPDPWRPPPAPPPSASPSAPSLASWGRQRDEPACHRQDLPVIPVPGRHASRRSRQLALPVPWRGEVALGPAQVTVLALGVAVALAITCWWLVRADARELEAPAIRPQVADGSPSALVEVSPVAAGASPSVSGSGSVTVDVAGKVRKPGIAVLDAGSRVVDAIEAAGGARRGVDLTSLNLARLLTDGEQILVGASAPAGAAAAAVPTPGASAAGALVNLNTATATEFEALPQVGPVTAAAIVAWRDEHGGFSAVDELLEVDGIGDATLAQIAPHVTI